MTGANAGNLHIGSRSEVLADYFFGTFGPVTPVRLHDDYGLDLYCVLSERVGQRLLPVENFAVQVKSNPEPWEFKEAHEIRWLLGYSSPVFLCVVNKKSAIVEVFHTFGRFAVPPSAQPSSLVLVPGSGDSGTFCDWRQSGQLDLSAPIIRAEVTEFYDETRHAHLRSVLASWLQHDRRNLDCRRMGIARYQMPMTWEVNSISPTLREVGYYPTSTDDIARGLHWLAEAIDCVGDQLRFLRDMRGAVRAALLLDHLRGAYRHAQRSWPDPALALHVGRLIDDVSQRLALAKDSSGTFALSAFQDEVDAMPRVVAAVEAMRAEKDPRAFVVATSPTPSQ